MTPLLATAIGIAVFLVVGIVLLYAIGEVRTLFPDAKCRMCRYYAPDVIPNIEKDWDTCVPSRGNRIYPDQYGCADYKRKWWMFWVSREAPGSGG